jgi:hypothetical protein
MLEQLKKILILKQSQKKKAKGGTIYGFTELKKIKQME